jgi:hypothetical protein
MQRWVIAANGNPARYMDAAGKWGGYETAKRFKRPDDADTFAAKHGVTDHGLFPCSKQTTCRYVLRMYRLDQTHPVAFAAWRDDSRVELLRIARLNKQEGFYLQLNDTETGVCVNV